LTLIVNGEETEFEEGAEGYGGNDGGGEIDDAV
jgi:hypothetical protein